MLIDLYPDIIKILLIIVLLICSALISGSEVAFFSLSKTDLKKIRSKKKNFSNLNLQKTPNIMGVLNLTPDSFSDGGKFNTSNKGIKHALEMFYSGANIIDIGGESTRPGSKAVVNKTEWKRIEKIIKFISKKIPISLDTRKSEIMKKGIKHGIKIINDVSGLEYDPETINVLKKYKIPFIFTSHSLGVFIQENGLDRISAEKEIFNSADKITASSQFEKENLLNRYGADKLKIHIVTPGLNGKTFKAFRGEKRKNIILSVGRIQKQKGQLQTLDLFKNLQYRIKGLELIFVGGPSGADGEAYLTKMKNKIEELRIEDEVQFVGSLSQKKLVKLMRKSKLLIHSAESETFGLVAIEAHRSGLPVLSTNQGSFKEIISNNEDGLVSKSFEDIQVYDFIIKLFENEEYRSQLINNAVKNSLVFNWEITAQNLKKAYKNIT